MAEGAELVSELESDLGLLYREEEVLGKGVGCVAICRIKKGTLLLREKPVFDIKIIGDEKNYLKHFVDLTSQDQEKYLGLYNVYDSHSSEWSNQMKSDLEAAMRESNNLNFPGSGISQEQATRIWQIRRTNSFDRGVCLKMSRFNHSCHANIGHFWNTATETRDLMVMRDIREGEEITLSYKQYWMTSREERRRELRESFNFLCMCELCDISEDEIEKEINNYQLFSKEKEKQQMFKEIKTYQSVIEEAECLKRMYRLARDMKALNRRVLLADLIEELFDVSCQGFLSAANQRGNRETEKAKWMKDAKFFAATGLKMATTLFGQDGLPLPEHWHEVGAQNWKEREKDPIKYFLVEYGGAINYS